MSKLIDLTGQRFGRLTVVERAESRMKSGEAYWQCLCDCGNLCVIRSSHLRSGNTKSCKCFCIEQKTEQIKRLHIAQGADGHCSSPLYATWKTMIARCYNNKHISYSQYGLRGIRVCREWKSDFGAFERWAMANGWKKGLTLDRIDNNNGYCPKNCRWVTPKEQNNNKRNNIVLIYKGQKQTIAQWAFESGINYDTLIMRYKRGWSVERMLTEPVKTTKQKSEPGD